MNMLRSLRLAVLGVLLLCLSVADSVDGKAGPPKPAWMQQVTKGKPGKFGKVPACELTYYLSWNGILKAGEAKLKLGKRDPKAPSLMLGTCEGRSAGLAKRLWYYKNLFKSRVEPKSLRPVYFEAQETEKKEKIYTTARFANGVVKSKETVRRKGRKDKVKERVFAFDHAQDLLSTVLYLRSFPLNNGDEINMAVHPFKSAYFAKFKVLGRETFKSDLGKVKAIKIDIKLHKIDRDNLELKSYDKFKKATIWISEDEYRMPLEVRSEVFIGSVRASLKARKPLK